MAGDNPTCRGQCLTLRHRWADGTTHLRIDLLDRLAVLTPRPRATLILYDGVLATRTAPTHPSRCVSVGRADAANAWARCPRFSCTSTGHFPWLFPPIEDNVPQTGGAQMMGSGLNLIEKVGLDRSETVARS